MLCYMVIQNSRENWNASHHASHITSLEGRSDDRITDLTARTYSTEMSKRTSERPNSEHIQTHTVDYSLQVSPLRVCVCVCAVWPAVCCDVFIGEEVK